MLNFKKACCIIIIIGSTLLAACGRDSSPEGRMAMKLEDLQKNMMDSLRKQNAAMLDSFGKIRQELNRLQEKK
ncbi:MAG: hypothetical protein JWQ96_1664 [Segetibacter sp.]|nr:hypothetical protein [Segetibacter sp.]